MPIVLFLLGYVGFISTKPRHVKGYTLLELWSFMRCYSLGLFRPSSSADPSEVNADVISYIWVQGGPSHH